MNNFFPNCVKSWNNIGDQLRNSVALSKFKIQIYSLTRPPKKSVFGIHDPNGIKPIFRLRLGLSQLKYHKKGHNFLDTPTDLCDCRCGPEDSLHFLLGCNQYVACRQNLLLEVQTILRKYDLNTLLDNLDVYLYDHRRINDDDNNKILLATIRFINESGRFG